MNSETSKKTSDYLPIKIKELWLNSINTNLEYNQTKIKTVSSKLKYKNYLLKIPVSDNNIKMLMKVWDYHPPNFQN